MAAAPTAPVHSVYCQCCLLLLGCKGGDTGYQSAIATRSSANAHDHASKHLLCSQASCQQCAKLAHQRNAGGMCRSATAVTGSAQAGAQCAWRASTLIHLDTGLHHQCNGVWSSNSSSRAGAGSFDGWTYAPWVAAADLQPLHTPLLSDHPVVLY
jgi:hypothetical protein